MRWLIVCAVLCLGGGVAQAVEVDLEVVAMIESLNNPLAYNSRSGAVGKYQITLICLKDYNLAHIRGGYNHNEMFDEVKAEKVARWYFKRIEGYLKAFNVPVTLEHVLMSYNWGIGNVRKWYQEGADYSKLPKETRDYIVKYNRLTN